MQRMIILASSALSALLVSGCSQSVARQSDDLADCSAKPVDLGRGVEILDVTRTYKGADGESHWERVKIPGETKTFYEGTTTLTQFDLGDPTKVVLVYGHPNIQIKKHPSPYREIFILLSGSSETYFPDGSKLVRKAGDMVIVEDQGTPGRSGRAGPCGYVALDLQFKPKAP